MLIYHIVFILLPSYYYSQWLLLIKSISFYPIHHNNKYQLSIIIHKSLLLCFLLAILRSIFFLFSFIETRDKNAYLACIPFCTGPVTKRIQNKRLKTITQYVYSFAIAIQSSVRIFLEECCIKNRSYILRLASRPLRVSLSMPLLVYILMKRICSCQRFAYARFTMYIYMCVWSPGKASVYVYSEFRPCAGTRRWFLHASSYTVCLLFAASRRCFVLVWLGLLGAGMLYR